MHNLKKVRFLDDFIIDAVFEDNTEKKYDVKPLFEKIKVFNELKNNNLFKLGFIDTGGYGLVWTDNIDLSADEIYNKGV